MVSIVLLPQPEGPSNTRNSPYPPGVVTLRSATVKSRFSTASTSPLRRVAANRLVTPRSSMMGGVVVMVLPIEELLPDALKREIGERGDHRNHCQSREN